jgi:putative ABC transport system ATP-binding protein
VQPTAGPVPPAVELSHVVKIYREGESERVVLRDVDARVAPGEIVVLLGRSGSGKSTLLNLIAGLDRPTAGTVAVAGRRIDNLSESGLARFRARHVGIIFQFFNLLDDLTVADNVLLPAQLAGASRRTARARAGELLERMGIERHRDDYPARLSGGQRQRVAIARALVNNPQFVLADEPTGNLDPDLSLEIMNLFREINARGTTVVVVGHRHDPVAVGRVVERGQADGLPAAIVFDHQAGVVSVEEQRPRHAEAPGANHDLQHEHLKCGAADHHVETGAHDAVFQFDVVMEPIREHARAVAGNIDPSHGDSGKITGSAELLVEEVAGVESVGEP